MTSGELPRRHLVRLRATCNALPEAVEELAWTGIRWKVHRRTFAHVLTIEAGWPPAYARAAGTPGPADVLMIRSSGAELDALRHAPPPFFTTPWRADEIGIQLTDDTDWTEIAELVTESYRFQAPARLARLVGAPTDEQPGDAT